jgi:hypothetical protein
MDFASLPAVTLLIMKKEGLMSVLPQSFPDNLNSQPRILQ